MDTPNPFAPDCPFCAAFRAQLALAREPVHPENACSVCGGSGRLLTPAALAFNEEILAELDPRWLPAKKGGAA
jgi:hypothetical protein